MPADLVADRVADDGAERGDGHHQAQGGTTLVGDGAAGEQSELARDDESDKRRRFQRGEYGDTEVGGGAAKRAERVKHARRRVAGVESAVRAPWWPSRQVCARGASEGYEHRRRRRARPKRGGEHVGGVVDTDVDASIRCWTSGRQADAPSPTGALARLRRGTPVR